MAIDYHLIATILIETNRGIGIVNLENHLDIYSDSAKPIIKLLKRYADVKIEDLEALARSKMGVHRRSKMGVHVRACRVLVVRNEASKKMTTGKSVEEIAAEIERDCPS